MSVQLEVGSAFDALALALKKREKELDEREAELSKLSKRLESDITSIYGDTGPSDVIHISIGGQKIAILRRTLCSVEGSMLASRFSGRWALSIKIMTAS